MTTITRMDAGLAITVALALAACGDNKADNGVTTTTRLDAVDVPQGTISDELMPLDTRNESSAGAAIAPTSDTTDPAAPAATDTRNDAAPQSAADSESETDQ